MKLILASFLTTNGKSNTVYTYTASDESSFEEKDIVEVPVGTSTSQRSAKVEIIKVISDPIEVEEELSKLKFPVSKLVDITACPKVEDIDNA